jgi:hypothetical protein
MNRTHVSRGDTAGAAPVDAVLTGLAGAVEAGLIPLRGNAFEWRSLILCVSGNSGSHSESCDCRKCDVPHVQTPIV